MFFLEKKKYIYVRTYTYIHTCNICKKNFCYKCYLEYKGAREGRLNALMTFLSCLLVNNNNNNKY